MYAAHFGLREPPFAITPDPAYVYLSRYHQEALAHLLYGVGENGGFVQLTGEVGTGKTTLVRTLLEQRLENVDIALCLNPRLTVEELLATICDELGASYPREPHTLKALLDALNSRLLQTHTAGRRTVLILDEAQNLSREVLEQIRLLTNLETTKQKLLRIILVGQPELRTLLARPDLRQLAQRITARYHLLPLGRRETAAYIGHRLRVAGGREDLFTWGARQVIYRHSGGIPRLINIICDVALLGAFGRGARRVNASLARAAAHEALQGREGGRTWQPSLALGVGFAGLAMIGIGLWLPRPKPAPTVASTVPPSRIVSPEPGEARETLSTSASVAPAPTANTPSLDWAAWLRKAAADNARDRLLAVWSIAQPLGGKGPFCEQVKVHQLRCLAGRGDWDLLRLYDRPALLRLTMPGGRSGQVLLRALTQDNARLEIAGEVFEVPLSQLTSLWTRDYLLLWRSPINQLVLGPGATGEEVLWLRRRLAQAMGQTAPEPLSALFDADLSRQLRAFQQDRGLQPDGLAGERTLVLLNNLVPEPNTPVLRPTEGGR